MPKYALRYARRAEDDLAEIGAYLKGLRGAEFANEFLGKLRTAIETLHDNAHTWREREELGAGRRALVVRPYVIFYRLDGAVVNIQRVLQGSRNIRRSMFED